MADEQTGTDSDEAVMEYDIWNDVWKSIEYWTDENGIRMYGCKTSKPETPAPPVIKV